MVAQGMAGENPMAKEQSSSVAVWSVIENMSEAELNAWRIEGPSNRPSIEERNLDLPHPYGWFVACFSSDLKNGDVLPLRYFDQELVLSVPGRNDHHYLLDPRK